MENLTHDAAFTIVNPTNGAYIRGGFAGIVEAAQHAMLEGEYGTLLLGYGVLEKERNWYNFDTQTWEVIPAKPTEYHRWDDDSHLWVDQRVLADFKKQQLVVINRAYEADVATLTAGYPASEIATWPNQQRDAQAWEVDPDALTPYLDGIADARGIDRLDLLAMTLTNVNLFLVATAKFTGTRQRLRDAIEAATTEAEVLAVVWP